MADEQAKLIFDHSDGNRTSFAATGDAFGVAVPEVTASIVTAEAGAEFWVLMMSCCSLAVGAIEEPDQGIRMGNLNRSTGMDSRASFLLYLGDLMD